MVNKLAAAINIAWASSTLMFKIYKIISGVKVQAKPDQAINMRLNTFAGANNAMSNANKVTTSVITLVNLSDAFLHISWLMAAVQLRICESAVDMLPAKIPARMMPIKMLGNSSSDNKGKANSASKPCSNGIKRRADRATKNVSRLKAKYQP